MRIGIAAYAESGKDEVADVLVAEYGFVKINMSDALDKHLQILNPVLDRSGIRYAELRSKVDYVTAKRHPEVRRLLQKFGTDVGREIDVDLWVREVSKLAFGRKHVVTTGIRYTNEAVPGMCVVRVNRPGYGPLNDHSSESLDDVFALADVTIDNDGTLEQLRHKVRLMADILDLSEVAR